MRRQEWILLAESLWLRRVVPLPRPLARQRRHLALQLSV
jgi:hypothetical protein